MSKKMIAFLPVFFLVACAQMPPIENSPLLKNAQGESIDSNARYDLPPIEQAMNVDAALNVERRLLNVVKEESVYNGNESSIVADGNGLPVLQAYMSSTDSFNKISNGVTGLGWVIRDQSEAGLFIKVYVADFFTKQTLLSSLFGQKSGEVDITLAPAAGGTLIYVEGELTIDQQQQTLEQLKALLDQ